MKYTDQGLLEILHFCVKNQYLWLAKDKKVSDTITVFKETPLLHTDMFWIGTNYLNLDYKYFETATWDYHDLVYIPNLIKKMEEEVTPTNEG